MYNLYIMYIYNILHNLNFVFFRKNTKIQLLYSALYIEI